MMGKTEARLHDATTALGATLAPDDIPPLRLPESPPGTASAPRFRLAGRRLASRRWLQPLAAAAAMAAVIGVVVVGGRVLAGPSHGQAASGHHASSSVQRATGNPGLPAGLGSAHMPRYLITTIDGQAAVKTSASGRLVAGIPRPAGIHAYEGVAAAADGRTYFLAGVSAAAGRWQIEFFRVRLGPDGQPGRADRLPGRSLVMQMPIISGGWVNFPFAVSPDGRELAFTSGTPFPTGTGSESPTAGTNERLIVQNVATGSRRSWSAWKSAEAVITQFSWGQAGQLGYDLAIANARVSGGRLISQPRGGDVSAFMVLSTNARGSGLISNSHTVAQAVLHTSRMIYEPQGVLSPDGLLAYIQLSVTQGSGQLTEVFAATGQVRRVLLSGYQASLGEPMSIDSSGRYLLFPLRIQSAHPVSSQAPYTLAHLARLDLRTGKVTELRIPVMARINGAFDAAW